MKLRQSYVNPKIDAVVRKIRKKNFKLRKHAHALCWREREYLEGEVKAGVIILPTMGCRWGRKSGCTMCGYVYDASSLSQSELLEEFIGCLDKLDNIEYLKIFNSGSFFDEEEIRAETREKIFEEINKRKIRRVQVETRPEFLNEENLDKSLSKLDSELEIGLGIETVSDYVRINCINKNSLFKDYKRAIRLCRSLGAFVKAYLLLKPPFLTEKEAMDDCVSSAIKLSKLVDRISINPVNVQKGTLVELLFRNGEYRPPWLWSLLEVMRKIKEKVSIPLLSHPVAAGKPRGVHNCGKCDHRVYRAIVNFSATQNGEYLDEVDYCRCREEWDSILRFEHLKY